MRTATKRPLAARLRHRIVLETPVESADGGGGSLRNWSAAANLWAAIEPLAGERRIDGAQSRSAASHRITIRYRADVTSAMRVSFGSRRFAIRAILAPEEARRRLVLLCEEVPAA